MRDGMSEASEALRAWRAIHQPAVVPARPQVPFVPFGEWIRDNPYPRQGGREAFPSTRPVPVAEDPPEREPGCDDDQDDRTERIRAATDDFLRRRNP